ncbi:MAG: TauD/TfdA family dioxygenase [Lysobacterales bacterium]|nr:MAG: TauD/TfdA family dioxygenase [Xanthomonadales bacterium]
MSILGSAARTSRLANITKTSNLQVNPHSGAVGAEIDGVDLRGDLSNAQLAEIRRAYHDHGVIFFRDQPLTPEQHIAFARRWGEINVNRFFKHVEGYPQIAEVRKEPNQKDNVGSQWHADHSYDLAPAMGSMLLAMEVPEVGGDTLFSSMYYAYEALSGGMKTVLEGLRAVHSSRHVFGAERYSKDTDVGGRLGNSELATQDSVHPVVIRHPETGRKALYVNRTFTLRFDGWTVEESAPLLEFLYTHASRPEFTCRIRWRRHSMAFWDNRAVWHMALNDYDGHCRVMHRITIEGVPLK